MCRAAHAWGTLWSSSSSAKSASRRLGRRTMPNLGLERGDGDGAKRLQGGRRCIRTSPLSSRRLETRRAWLAVVGARRDAPRTDGVTAPRRLSLAGSRCLAPAAIPPPPLRKRMRLGGRSMPQGAESGSSFGDVPAGERKVTSWPCAHSCCTCRRPPCVRRLPTACSPVDRRSDLDQATEVGDAMHRRSRVARQMPTPLHRQHFSWGPRRPELHELGGLGSSFWSAVTLERSPCEAIGRWPS